MKKKKLSTKLLFKKKNLNAYICANEKAIMPRQYNRDKGENSLYFDFITIKSNDNGGKYKRATTPFTNIIILVELSLF